MSSPATSTLLLPESAIQKFPDAKARLFGSLRLVEGFTEEKVRLADDQGRALVVAETLSRADAGREKAQGQKRERRDYRPLPDRRAAVQDNGFLRPSI